MTEVKRASDLAARLQEAREASKMLANESEVLNQALAQVEKALVALNLGVSALVVLKPEEGDKGELSLAFFRSTKGLGLFIHEQVNKDDEGNVTALIQTSREIRLRAVDHLPQLLEALIELTKLRGKQVAERVAKLGEFLDVVEGSRS